MKDIKTLKDFIKYCKSVSEDSNELFLITIFASQLSKEELLSDIEECLSIYYKWLKITINQELYLDAVIIRNAREAEIKHYIDLGKALKKPIKGEIELLNNKLRYIYLGF